MNNKVLYGEAWRKLNEALESMRWENDPGKLRQRVQLVADALLFMYRDEPVPDPAPPHLRDYLDVLSYMEHLRRSLLRSPFPERDFKEWTSYINWMQQLIDERDKETSFE